jgi:hypothetical protein
MNLVFHQAALGDFAMILPILRGLEPPTMFVGPWSRGRLVSALIDGVQHADIEMFEFGRLHRPGGPSTLSPAVREWFDEAQVIISFVAEPEGDWAENVVRLAPQANLTCLPTRPPPGSGLHLIDYHASRLIDEGIPLRSPTQDITGDPEGPVVIHPGSGGADKCWPAERFETVIRAYRHARRPVRVIYGEAEAERWPQDQLERWHAEHDARGCGSLEQLVEQLLGASAYLGNDAGPTHLAAQLGLPTTALFGPTAPGIWSPRGPMVHVLAPDQPTAMSWLPVDQVLDHLSLDPA